LLPKLKQYLFHHHFSAGIEFLFNLKVFNISDILVIVIFLTISFEIKRKRAKQSFSI